MDTLTYREIYVDGSCLGNGTEQAVAGVGIWVEGHPELCYSGGVDVQLPQTNNVAELLAIDKAYEIITTNRWTRAVVYTDSQYSISALTHWYESWEGRGWLTSSGNMPENLSIIRSVRSRIDNARLDGYAVTMQKVKGHSTNAGNRKANDLAIAGSKMARVEMARLAAVSVRDVQPDAEGRTAFDSLASEIEGLMLDHSSVVSRVRGHSDSCTPDDAHRVEEGSDLEYSADERSVCVGDMIMLHHVIESVGERVERLEKKVDAILGLVTVSAAESQQRAHGEQGGKCTRSVRGRIQAVSMRGR